MKLDIQVGKFFKNNRNQVIKILILDANNENYPIIGCNVKTGHPVSYTLKGCYSLMNIGQTSNLIAECDEPSFIREKQELTQIFGIKQPDTGELVFYASEKDATDDNSTGDKLYIMSVE